MKLQHSSSSKKHRILFGQKSPSPIKGHTPPTFFFVLFYPLSLPLKGLHPLFLHLWALCEDDIPLVVFGFIVHSPAIFDWSTSMKDYTKHKVHANNVVIILVIISDYLKVKCIPALSAMSAIWQLSKSTLPLYPSLPPIVSCTMKLQKHHNSVITHATFLQYTNWWSNKKKCRSCEWPFDILCSSPQWINSVLVSSISGP